MISPASPPLTGVTPITDRELWNILELAAKGAITDRWLAIVLRPGANWTGPGDATARSAAVAHRFGYLTEPRWFARTLGRRRTVELTKTGRWRLRELRNDDPWEASGRRTLQQLWEHRLRFAPRWAGGEQLDGGRR